MLPIALRSRLLGQCLPKEGMHPIKLLQRIRSTSRPQNKDNAQAFLVLDGCYQKFIPNFTELIHAL